MKKIITLIALTSLMFVACQKNNSAPTSPPNNTQAPTTAVYCIYSSPTATQTIFLECCTGTQNDAVNRCQWYRDNNYVSVTSKQKSNCSECQ